MVRIASRSRSLVGESPVWSETENALWWVDIRGRCVRRLSLHDGAEREIATPELAGGIVLGADGHVYGVFETGLFRLDPLSRWRFLSAPADLPATHRFNDVTVDPKGRLIAGTMQEAAHGPAANGALYSYDGRGWRRLFSGFWTINGLAFSRDGRTLYFSDSNAQVRRIWRCDYDPKTGEAGERRTFIDMAQMRGRPDGAVVDAEDAYWIAGIGGGCLYQFSPAGRLLQEVEMPVERPTKPVFAGARLERLFVTTLSVGLERVHHSGWDGALLELPSAVLGAPPFLFSAAAGSDNGTLRR